MAKKDNKKKVVAKKAVAKKATPAKKADKKVAAPKKTAVPAKKVVAKPKPIAQKQAPAKKKVAPKPVTKPTKSKPIAPTSAKSKNVTKVKVSTVSKAKPTASKPVATKVPKNPVKPTAPIKEKAEIVKKKPEVKKPLVKPLVAKKPEIVVPKVNKPIQIEGKEKMHIKKQLLQKCLEIQTSIINNAKKAMDDAQQSANEEKNSNEEMTDSFRETMHATRDVYARQVQEGINTLGLLNRIMIKTQEVVKFGAVVVTDFQNYFISAGLGEVKIDDKNFVTVSTLTPLYQILSEKKKGDLFMFLDRKYRILDVF